MQKFLLLCSLVLGLMFPAISFSQNAVNTGADLGNQALQQYGSQANINRNLYQPMISGASPMTTLDGSQQFNAQLFCPSSQRFMEILVQPGPTGDIITLIISQDTDFDGTLDYTYQAPFIVSGVCANGVISCAQGSWDYCRSYEWYAGSDSKVSLQETTNTNLGGCYCINASCGSNLVFNDMSVIMNSLGGGVVGAIHSTDPRYVLSGVTIDGMLADYYGQNSGQCMTTAAAPGNVEEYFYDPGPMEGAASTLAASQQGDPNSYYSIMTNTMATQKAAMRTCRVTRGSVIQWTPEGDCSVADTIDDECSEVETDSGCTLKEETIDGVVTMHDYVWTGLEPNSSCMSLSQTKSASCSYGCPDQPGTPCYGDPPVCTLTSETTENCEILDPIIDGGGSGAMTSAYGAGNVAYFGNGANVVFNAGITVWGFAPLCEGNGIAVYGSGHSPGVDPNTGNPYDSYIDIYSNPYYPLQGTLYVSGAVITGADSFYSCSNTGIYYTPSTFGFSPKAYCSGGPNLMTATYFHCPLVDASGCMGNPAYCSKTCTEQPCRDWWNKQRTYICTGSGFDFSNIRQRVNTIKQSTMDNITSIYYQDYRQQDNGTWAYENNTYNTTGAYRPVVANCEQACKTRIPQPNTDTTVLDTRTDYLINPTEYNFYYKKCTTQGCPLVANEEIVEDCQCIDEFTEAALIMQLIRMGGKDFICSSGTMSEPQ